MPHKKLDDCTQNIYTSWLETVDCNGFRSQRIKKLSSFTIEELNHLKWLIGQEIAVRGDSVYQILPHNK